MQVLEQLAVLRPSQDRVGVQRLLDRQALVIVEWFSALGRRGRYTEVVALGPHIERFGSEAGLVQHGRQWHTSPFAGAEYHPFLCPRGLWSFASQVLEERGVAAGTLHNGAHTAT